MPGSTFIYLAILFPLFYVAHSDYYTDLLLQSKLIPYVPSNLYSVPSSISNAPCTCTLNGLTSLPAPYTNFPLASGSYFFSVTPGTWMQCLWTTCDCRTTATGTAASDAPLCGCPCECSCGQHTNPCPSVSVGLVAMSVIASIDNRNCVPPLGSRTQLFGAGYVEGMSWSQATLGYLAYTPDVQGIYYAPNATFVNGFAYRNAHRASIQVTKMDTENSQNITTANGTGSTYSYCPDALLVTNLYDSNAPKGPFCGRSVPPPPSNQISYSNTGFFVSVFNSSTSASGVGYQLSYTFTITSAASVVRAGLEPLLALLTLVCAVRLV